MNLNETPYALEIEDLSVEFRTRDRTVYAVNGLDLKIRKGETLGLVGETGAGKTTTGLAILNLIQSPPGVVTHGSISVNGSCVLRIAEPEAETPEEAPVPAENAGTVKLQKETPAEKEPEKPAKAMRRKDQKPRPSLGIRRWRALLAAAAWARLPSTMGITAIRRMSCWSRWRCWSSSCRSFRRSACASRTRWINA